jgi:hypothetical protein
MLGTGSVRSRLSDIFGHCLWGCPRHQDQPLYVADLGAGKVDSISKIDEKRRGLVPSNERPSRSQHRQPATLGTGPVRSRLSDIFGHCLWGCPRHQDQPLYVADLGAGKVDSISKIDEKRPGLVPSNERPSRSQHRHPVMLRTGPVRSRLSDIFGHCLWGCPRHQDQPL